MKKVAFLEKTLALLFWFLLVLGFDSKSTAFLTVIAALIHEGGHLLAGYFFARGMTSLPRADISGFRIRAERMSYKEELSVALGGPVLNLILAILFVCLPLPKTLCGYFRTFALINALTALSNLLPISNFDGYRIAECLLSIKTKNPMVSARVMNTVSFAFCTVATFLSLYLILKTGDGYWIFAVFFTSVFTVIVKRTKNNILRENGRF